MIQVVIPEDRLAALAASDTADQAEDPTPNAGGDTQQDVTVAAEQPQDKDNDQSPVPYSRFSEVIAAKNAAKAKADVLEQELAELKAGRSATRDDASAEFAEADYTVEGRLQRIELAEASKKLDAEVAAARAKFPKVPESVLYKAVTEDPSIDVEVVAQGYSNYLSKIEQAAVQEYLAANPGVAQAPKVPPALKTTASGGQVKAKPRTLEEAHAAMRASLNTADW